MAAGPVDGGARWQGAEPASLRPASPAGLAAGAVRALALAILAPVTMLGYACAVALAGHRGGRWVTGLWSRSCLQLTGLRLRRVGAPMRSGGAIVANHSSWLDILALGAAAPVHFVAKAEVAGWPGIGALARLTGTIFIERRRTEAKRQEAELIEQIAAGRLLAIFPEGTSTDGMRVLPFKSALFSVFFSPLIEGRDWVQPISVHYAPAAGSGLPPTFYGWWGAMEFFPHIWAVLTRSFGGTATVMFHAPQHAQAFGNRKALAAHCAAEAGEGLAWAMRGALAVDAGEGEGPGRS